MNIEEIEKIDFRSIYSEANIKTGRFHALHKQDTLCIGTKHYQGLAYFWACRYKHDLRDATPKKRKEVHLRFLTAGLAVSDESKEHDRIMNESFKTKSYLGD